TVEFTVGEVYLMPSSWAASADDEWGSVPLRLVAKAAGKTDPVYVLVSGQTVARLRQLGIEEPAEHFRGKVVRVSGPVERWAKRAGTNSRLPVNSLDQRDFIRKP